MDPNAIYGKYFFYLYFDVSVRRLREAFTSNGLWGKAQVLMCYSLSFHRIQLNKRPNAEHGHGHTGLMRVGTS